MTHTPDRNDALMPDQIAPYKWDERTAKNYNARQKWNAAKRKESCAEERLRDEVNAEVAAADDTPERDPQTMSQHRDRIGRLFDAIGMAEVRR